MLVLIKTIIKVFIFLKSQKAPDKTVIQRRRKTLLKFVEYISFCTRP